jgi:PKD repeat protein
MNKSFFFVVVSFLFNALNLSAQNTFFDATNARDGETVEYCHQHKLHVKNLANPAYVQSLQNDEIIRQHEAFNSSTTKGIVYKIPIVFHVLHINGAENISDAQIKDALFILNRDFRKQNADANNVHVDFQGMPSDIEVEFVLATKAPNGACFKGITRTFSSLSYQGDDGGDQVAAVKAGNDVFQGEWASNKYLNIFICGNIGGAAGYTYKPGGWQGTNMSIGGIWVLHNYVGSIGTSSLNTSRTLTHEVGHWLNLDHTWGGNNNPGNASSCSTDDAVQDTPNCIGVTACVINSNTCNSDDAYWGFPMRDNVENYMDYSYCSKMFTTGQRTRMRAALTSSIAGRSNLWTSSNLAATGADGNVNLCKTDFTVNKTSICVGELLQFTDATYNAATGWSWTFQNGTPATSTAQNPQVTFDTPGIYTVTLTATDGTTSQTETKTQYIHVLPKFGNLPFLETFENYTNLSNTPNWEVVNPSDFIQFEVGTTGLSSAKSAYLNNYNSNGSQTDELISAAVDLSSITSAATLSFRFSYRKKATANFESLKVFLSSDCGVTWQQRKTLTGSQLSTLVLSSPWIPSTPEDWTTVHMTNVTSAYWVDNFRYKFKFEGNGGNNIYLDNINIYAGSPSDNVVAGIDETPQMNGVNLYPNPADEEVTLSFTSINTQAITVAIQDVFGKTIQTHKVLAQNGSNLVFLDTQKLASGTYFVSLLNGGIPVTIKFVKE